MQSEYNSHCGSTFSEVNSFVPNWTTYKDGKQRIRAALTFSEPYTYNYEKKSTKPTMMFINSQYFVAGSDPIQIFDLNRGRLINQIQVDKPPIAISKFSPPNETKLVIMSQTKEHSMKDIFICDALDCSGAFVKQIRLTHESSKLYTFGSRYMFKSTSEGVCVFDIMDEQFVLHFDRRELKGESITFLGSSKVCISAYHQQICAGYSFLSMTTGEELGYLQMTNGDSVCALDKHHVAISTSGGKTFFGNNTKDEAEIIVFNHETMHRIYTIPNISSSTSSIESLGDFKLLVANSYNNVNQKKAKLSSDIVIIDLKTGEKQLMWENKHALTVFCLDDKRRYLCLREGKEERKYDTEHSLLSIKSTEIASLVFYVIKCSSAWEAMQERMTVARKRALLVDITILMH
jgi:hypothetical protein